MPRLNAITMGNTARPPFDDEDADVIFRSSDNVEFRLYKIVIAKASPVFHTMIQLPQPSSSTFPIPPPVVELTEDAKTLENLLRFCYPVEYPNITSVEDIHNILEAARKYDIASVTANLRWIATRMLPKEPLRIYAIAYVFQMEDVAKEAAGLLLDVSQFHIPSSPPPEFNLLPSMAIYLLHIYRRKCAEVALHLLTAVFITIGPWDAFYAHTSGDIRKSAASGGGLEWSAAPRDIAQRIGTAHCRRLSRTECPLVCVKCARGAYHYENSCKNQDWNLESWIWMTCHLESSSTTRMRIGPGSRNGFLVRKWYEVYLEALSRALTERPSGRTVRSFLATAEANEAFTQAAPCSSCAIKAHTDLTRFTGLLADQVDKAIAEVKTELPFSTSSQ